MRMSGTTSGVNVRTRLRRMSRSGLGSQSDLEGEPSLEEFGHSSEVANATPSSFLTLGAIDLCDYLSGEELPIEFMSVQKWKNICLQRYQRLVDQTTTMGTDYLVFCKVTKDDLAKIDKSRHDFLRVRIYYDSSLELLIVKLMVGKAHKLASDLFADLLREKAQSRSGDRRALYTMGSFRCISAATGREKEPDVAVVPKSRNRAADWPSLVIETGVSERLAALKSDAHFWIFNNGGLTRVVLLIAIDIQAKSITIERWGNVPPMYPSRAVGPNIRPRKIQSVTIDINGVVGAPLNVPSDLIFDVGNLPAGVLPTDFSFDAAELLAFFAEFWGMLT